MKLHADEGGGRGTATWIKLLEAGERPRELWSWERDAMGGIPGDLCRLWGWLSVCPECFPHMAVPDALYPTLGCFYTRLILERHVCTHTVLHLVCPRMCILPDRYNHGFV